MGNKAPVTTRQGPPIAGMKPDIAKAPENKKKTFDEMVNRTNKPLNTGMEKFFNKKRKLNF